MQINTICRTISVWDTSTVYTFHLENWWQEDIQSWLVTDSSFWCSLVGFSVLVRHDNPSCMHVRTRCDVCLHICPCTFVLSKRMWVQLHVMWNVWSHMCYETKEVKHLDGSRLTMTDLFLKMLKWFHIWLTLCTSACKWNK